MEWMVRETVASRNTISVHDLRDVLVRKWEATKNQSGMRLPLMYRSPSWHNISIASIALVMKNFGIGISGIRMTGIDVLGNQAVEVFVPCSEKCQIGIQELIGAEILREDAAGLHRSAYPCHRIILEIAEEFGIIKERRRVEEFYSTPYGC